MSKREAAQAALAAHDALRESHAREPACDENGLPRDAEAWLRWHEQDSRPAYAAWHKAMDDLDSALGEKVGRHPYTFRPICEEILA